MDVDTDEEAKAVLNPQGREANDERSPELPTGWSHQPHISKQTNQHVTRSSTNTFAEQLKAGAFASLCILDTNPLLSSLNFLQGLFQRLLDLSWSALLMSTEPPAFRIVLPFFVHRELDGLKKGFSRRAKEARDANQWLLGALMEQRKARTIRGIPTSVSLPSSHHPLVIQTSRQAVEAVASHPHAPVDERLADLTSSLQKDTSLPILFCTSDTNLRIDVENRGVRTFDLATVLKVINTTPNTAGSVLDGPSLLLEQWKEQLGIDDEVAPMELSGSNSGLEIGSMGPLAEAMDSSIIQLEDMDVDQAVLSQQDSEAAANFKSPQCTAPAPPVQDGIELNPTFEIGHKKTRRGCRGGRRRSKSSSPETSRDRGITSTASIHAPSRAGPSTSYHPDHSPPGRRQAVPSATAQRPHPGSNQIVPTGPRSMFSSSARSNGSPTIHRPTSTIRRGSLTGRSTGDSIWASDPGPRCVERSRKQVSQSSKAAAQDARASASIPEEHSLTLDDMMIED